MNSSFVGFGLLSIGLLLKLRTQNQQKQRPKVNKILLRNANRDDFQGWSKLWDEYLVFYKQTVPEEVTSIVWDRFFDNNSGCGCLIAINEERNEIVGFANYMTMFTTWDSRLGCYLEDLFVSSNVRGGGIGTKLINALGDIARKENWCRLFWVTQEDNYRARNVYEKVARKTEFIQYKYQL